MISMKGDQHFSLNSTCRTCLSTNSKNTLLSKMIMNSDLTSKQALLTLQISVEDGLPDKICETCVQRCTDFIIFRKQCKESELTLKKYFNNSIKDGTASLNLVTAKHIARVFVTCPKETSCRKQDECNSSKQDFLFPCDICGIKLVESAYKGHLQKFHPMVGTEVSTKLAAHTKSNIHSRKPHMCPVCKKIFTLKHNWKVHLTIHNKDKKISCTSCKLIFYNRKNLQKHVIRTHSGESHPCLLCSKTFTHASKLRLHMKSHVSDSEKRFCCKFCSKRFNHGHHLQNHERTHTGQRPFLCNVCGKGFIQSYALTVHMRIHTGFKPHKCQICDKSFPQSQTLALHARTHTGEKRFMCNQCGERFTTSTGLKRHMGSHEIHGMEDEEYKKDTTVFHSCKVCEIKFNSRTALDAHMRSHNCQYVCDVCKKGFILASAMDSHLRSHSSGNKKHICSDLKCSRVFNRLEHLKSHQRRAHSKDKPFVCELCSKRFCQSGDLKVHIRRHTGEKPYICSYCNKGFPASSSLTTHIRSHTGERPYVCAVCHRSFTNSSALTGHMVTHTSTTETN